MCDVLVCFLAFWEEPLDLEDKWENIPSCDDQAAKASKLSPILDKLVCPQTFSFFLENAMMQERPQTFPGAPPLCVRSFRKCQMVNTCLRSSRTQQTNIDRR